MKAVVPEFQPRKRHDKTKGHLRWDSDMVGGSINRTRRYHLAYQRPAALVAMQETARHGRC